MSSQGFPSGIDLVWMGVDSRDNLGAFVTGGVGPIPHSLDQTEISITEDLILELPISSDLDHYLSGNSASAFADLAVRGLYVFDWSDVHRVSKECLDAYERVAVPSSPIKIQNVQEELGAHSFKFPNSTFIFSQVTLVTRKLFE